VEICVIDADDLLDNPSGMIEAFCKTTGIEWDPNMLVWDTEKDQEVAKEAFEKWKGFHEDALDSDRLRARTHVSHD
jgi:DNA repair and recombination protein RAD54B